MLLESSNWYSKYSFRNKPKLNNVEQTFEIRSNLVEGVLFQYASWQRKALSISFPSPLTLYKEIIDVYLKRNGLLVLKQAPPFTDTHKENISNSCALIGLTAPLYIYGMWGGLVDCCCHVLVTVHNLLFIKL